MIADGILGADDLPTARPRMSAADADRPSRALADPASRCSLATLPLAMPCTSMYCVTTAIETTLLRIAWIEASMLWAVPPPMPPRYGESAMPAPIPGMCEAALAPTCSRVTMAILATGTAKPSLLGQHHEHAGDHLAERLGMLPGQDERSSQGGQANDDEAHGVRAHGDVEECLRESHRPCRP